MNFGKYINIPYKHKGADFNGCDCWGLYRLIFEKERGIYLPTFQGIYTKGWFRKGVDCIINSATPRHGFYPIDPPYELYDGLIFYHGNTKVANHIGLYIGSNKFIHVYSGGRSEVSRLDDYWKSKLYKSCRYVEWQK